MIQIESMTMSPLVRRVMLLMSLVMVGVVVNQMRNPQQAMAMLVMGGASVVLSLALVVWSVMQFGL